MEAKFPISWLYPSRLHGPNFQQVCGKHTNGNAVEFTKEKDLGRDREFEDSIDGWFDEMLNEPTQKIKCECGGRKAKTTCAHWCPLFIPS